MDSHLWQGNMGYCRSRAAERAAKRKDRERARRELAVQARRQRKTENKRKNRALERARLSSRDLGETASDDATYANSISCDRAAAVHARKLAYTLHEETLGKGSHYQRRVLEKLFDQGVLQPSLPDYVTNHKKLAQCQTVCDGLAEAWKGLKYGQGKDKYTARNVIEAAVVSVGDEKTLRAAATCIGMNKRTLRRAFVRRERLNHGASGEVWAKAGRKKRADALTQDVIDVTVSWWSTETRVSPCKKDVRKLKIGVKLYTTHARHFLEESVVFFLFSLVQNYSHALFVTYAKIPMWKRNC